MSPHRHASPKLTNISRRGFLKSATLLASGLVTGDQRGWAVEASPQRVIVGGHPWVYAARLPKYDITPVLPQIFADMSYAGLDGVELMSIALEPADAVERIAALAAKHQLPVLGASFGAAMWDRTQHETIWATAQVVIPRLGQLGGRTLGTSVGATPALEPKTEAQLDDQAAFLRKLIALCQEHGITLNLHNHTYEVINDLHDLKGTLARIPDVKLGPDLNWLVRAHIDPAAFLRQYGQQVVFMHLRDQKADGRWSEALGEGTTDFVAIAAALRDIHFAGRAVIELAHERDFTPTRPIRDSLKMSREFVRRVLGY